MNDGKVCDSCGDAIEEGSEAQCNTCGNWFCPECSDDYENEPQCLECKNEEDAEKERECTE